MGIRRQVARLSAGVLVLAPVLAVGGPAAGAASPDCFDPAAGITVEEARATGRVPQEILLRSGFDRFAGRFAAELCGTSGLPEAEGVVAAHGRDLWRSAVRRAQGRGPAGDAAGDAGDDRPLYWARLLMVAELRRWHPSFELTGAERAALVADLERYSRGQRDLNPTAGRHMARIVVTGFDPFQLDADIRRSNPSGAAALALDGRIVRTAAGPAVIETATFPVRWRDFADGMVERTLLPQYSPGRRGAAAVITVSQGRPGRFDLEAHNGAWRGGSPDNERATRTETIPIPDGVPTVEPQPQWSDSTLPRDAIIDAVSGRFPVNDNTQVTEIPAGGTDPVVRPDGPTPGSTARAGGGGNYLSNEIAYRNTLLRDATRSDIPAGHVHTPVLEFGSGNSDKITDPDFERNRQDIVDQVRSIVAAALAR